jgi:hypothetical protein
VAINTGRSRVVIAGDNRRRGGCGRAITEIAADVDGRVFVLGPVRPRNNDPEGVLTTRLPEMRRARSGYAGMVFDSTNPAERRPPQLRTGLLMCRLLAERAGLPFPDGVPFAHAVAAEVANHAQVVRTWDPAGTTSTRGDARSFARADNTESHRHTGAVGYCLPPGAQCEAITNHARRPTKA